jgi:hypothetical protein
MGNEMKKYWIALIIVLLGWFAGNACFAQATASYDGLVQQGKTQLQSGNNDAALASANTAIKLNSDHWEAYVLAAGALINLGDCNSAALMVSTAIQHAPEDKKAGLHALTANCVPHGAPSSGAPNGPTSIQSNGPTLQETSSWLATTLKDYGGYREQTDNDADLVVTITDVGIGSDCSFSFTTKEVDTYYKGTKAYKTDTFSEKMVVPLGAVRVITQLWLERGDRHNTVSVSTVPVAAIRDIASFRKESPASQADIPVDRMPTAQLGGDVPQQPSDMIPRIEKALKRAVDLCQGTYAKPQSKGPF